MEEGKRLKKKKGEKTWEREKGEKGEESKKKKRKEKLEREEGKKERKKKREKREAVRGERKQLLLEAFKRPWSCGEQNLGDQATMEMEIEEQGETGKNVVCQLKDPEAWNIFAEKQSFCGEGVAHSLSTQSSFPNLPNQLLFFNYCWYEI